jgi:hypothetical protein
MTGPEHYAEAERLLALADRHTRPFTLMASRFTKARFWLAARPRFLIFPARANRVPERRRTVRAYG